MASINYNEGIQSLLEDDIDWLNDTIKCMLVTSTYSPNKDDSFIDTGGASDPVDARVAGTTDQTIGTKSIGKDTSSDFAFLKGANVTFTAVPAGNTVVGALVYKDTGTATTSKNIAYHDVTDTPGNGGDITIAWPSDGNGGITKFAL